MLQRRQLPVFLDTPVRRWEYFSNTSLWMRVAKKSKGDTSRLLGIRSSKSKFYNATLQFVDNESIPKDELFIEYISPSPLSGSLLTSSFIYAIVTSATRKAAECAKLRRTRKPKEAREAGAQATSGNMCAAATQQDTVIDDPSAKYSLPRLRYRMRRQAAVYSPDCSSPPTQNPRLFLLRFSLDRLPPSFETATTNNRCVYEEVTRCG